MDKLVDTYMNNDDDQSIEISQIAIDMQNGSGSILDLIQELGSHLVASEVASRIKACSLLGDFLQKLSDSYLSTNELTHLTEFLCARLQDHYTLQPSVLNCMQKISCSPNLDKKDADSLIDVIFREIHVQSCLQSDRYKIFQIFASIYESHKQLVISKGHDFIYNYIQAIDGEQDPRNLLIIFQLSSDLVKGGIELGNLVEEFFEVASCYFPIDFDPSAAGKKSSITNQDLVLGLRRVICSTEKFANFWIPLCLEKMESDIESAKLDSILTLIDCLPLYSKSSLEPFLSSLWSRLRQEITHVVSQDVEKTALKLLTEIVKTLSQWPVDSSRKTISDLESFLAEVLNDCLPRLEEPIQDKFTWMSGLMLLACAKGSKKGCHQISNAVIALLLKRAKKMQAERSASITTPPLPILPSGIHSVIEYMVKVMSVCSTFSFKRDQHPIVSYYKDLLTLFTSILMGKDSTPTKCIAVAGIASLLSLNLLNDENLVVIADCFASFFTCEVDLKLSNEILSASGFMASKYPLVVKSHFLPQIFKTIPENDAIKEPIKSVKKALMVLSALSTHFDILQLVVSYVMKLVENCKIDETTSSFLEECLNCLQQITKNYALGPEYVEHLSFHIALPLIKQSIETSLQLTTPGQCCGRCDSDEDFSIECLSLPFIKAVALVVRNICQKQKSGKAADLLVKKVSDLYLDKNITVFDLKPLNMITVFDPFNSNSSVLQTRTVCLLASSLCSFDTSVTIPQCVEFMEKLIDLTLQSSDLPTSVSAAKSFAGLLNKNYKSCDKIVEKVGS